MNSPIDEIAHYIDRLEDHVWIAQLAERHSVSVLLECGATLIANGDPDSAHNALTFSRHVGIFGILDRDLTTRFRAAMPTALFPALQRGLYSSAFSIRFTNQLKEGANYTLEGLETYIGLSASP